MSALPELLLVVKMNRLLWEYYQRRFGSTYQDQFRGLQEAEEGEEFDGNDT